MAAGNADKYRFCGIQLSGNSVVFLKMFVILWALSFLSDPKQIPSKANLNQGLSLSIPD